MNSNTAGATFQNFNFKETDSIDSPLTFMNLNTQTYFNLKLKLRTCTL